MTTPAPVPERRSIRPGFHGLARFQLQATRPVRHPRSITKPGHVPAPRGPPHGVATITHAARGVDPRAFFPCASRVARPRPTPQARVTPRPGSMPMSRPTAPDHPIRTRSRRSGGPEALMDRGPRHAVHQSPALRKGSLGRYNVHDRASFLKATPHCSGLGSRAFARLASAEPGMVELRSYGVRVPDLQVQQSPPSPAHSGPTKWYAAVPRRVPTPPTALFRESASSADNSPEPPGARSGWPPP